MNSYRVPFRQPMLVIVVMLGWSLAGLAPFAQAADQPEPLTTVQEDKRKGAPSKTPGEVQKRGIREKAPMPPDPFPPPKPSPEPLPEPLPEPPSPLPPPRIP